MKGMPLPFDFEGKGVFDLDFLVKSRDFIEKGCFLSSSFGEPTSVLDSARIPSGPTSSSSLGGGAAAASTDTAGVAAVSDANPSPKWQQDSTTATSSNAGGPSDSDLLPVPPSLEIGRGGNPEKVAMEDWESVLSESAAVSPSQEQAFLRWVMGDVDDPAKSLQIGAAEFDFSGGFGVVDQGFGGEQFGGSFMPSLPIFPNSNRSGAEKIGLAPNPISSNPNFKFPPNLMHSASVPNSLGAVTLHHPAAFGSSAEIKPPVFNPQLLINQHQPSFPMLFTQQQEKSHFGPPQAKPHNPGWPADEIGAQISRGPFTDTGQFPHYLQQQKPKMEESGHQQQQQQQAIVDQLFKAAELVQTGNPVLAQGILARLNHQLSPIGKPFNRAAFYCKEALQMLLHTNCNDVNNSSSTPFNLVFKIGAYKCFSEISPLVQFANFTCNQAILEALHGFDRIHIVDFDIGYGGQWASLMQELALHGGGAPSLKITALASTSTHDQLELSLTRENLIQFAREINIAFEFEAISIDSLNSASWSWPFRVQENEAVAVNLPVGSLANHQFSVPLIMRFVKQLSPRIVVSVDRGCDRTDLPFANHVVHALQSYSNLLESLDAVNVNMDALQKIERFLLQPAIEKIVMDRLRFSSEKTQHWRALFLSSGFSPITFSNFTESQAECVIKRTPVRGFQVEKRQSSLVLCWQRKELISATAWRC
ncbi:scarecrow-like protein 6 [Salvia divinorum]|uniref:Scarecrow-like protein 6 n=1 Tax=Salvia divinorum TaxID=28513 RepID=A0ABD1GKA6_SALDI